jgi:phosphoserine phosphatase RsbU/P
MHDPFKDLPCVYFSSSADGVILEANETLCQFLGYTREELIGKKLESIFSLATRIFQQTHFYPLLQLKGHAEEIYITLKAKDNRDMPILINATRKEKNGEFLLHYAGIPINERKKFEDEIVAAKKAAEKALSENSALKAAQEKLHKHAEELDRQMAIATLHNQELKQFNHLTTHTLQESVRKMMFYTSQILELDIKITTNNAVQKIRKTAEDMYAKLKGLQQYVWLKNEGLTWEEVHLNQVTITAKSQVESENAGITIQLESEDLPIIEANGEQIEILMQELLSNAVRFRKPETEAVHLKIFSSILLLNNFRQLKENYKYTQFIKLQIRDQGIGFDDKYQDQAFELFRKLHSTDTQGIGLALCRKIVENHNGSISLESQPGKGTTIIVYLPLKQEKIVL